MERAAPRPPRTAELSLHLFPHEEKSLKEARRREVELNSPQQYNSRALNSSAAPPILSPAVESISNLCPERSWREVEATPEPVQASPVLEEGLKIIFRTGTKELREFPNKDSLGHCYHHWQKS